MDIHPFDEFAAGLPGVVTVKDWMGDANGILRRMFFCDSWRIVTDATMPIEGFKSTEKWTLFGTRYNPVRDSLDVAVVIPGCQVQGFVFTEVPPKSTEVASYTSTTIN